MEDEEAALLEGLVDGAEDELPTAAARREAQAAGEAPAAAPQ